MTEKQFIARCRNAYRAGLARPELMRLLREWVDAMLRYQHTQFSHGQGQGQDWLRFINAEFVRTEQGRNTLANDVDGYGLVQFASILSHSCQQCAESRDAWWTRPGFCQHRKEAA